MRVKAKNYDVRLGDAVALLNTAIETLQLRAKALRGNGIGHRAQRQVRCHQGHSKRARHKDHENPLDPGTLSKKLRMT